MADQKKSFSLNPRVVLCVEDVSGLFGGTVSRVSTNCIIIQSRLRVFYILLISAMMSQQSEVIVCVRWITNYVSRPLNLFYSCRS